MKKLLILLSVIALAFVFTHSEAQTISKIHFEGEKNVSLHLKDVAPTPASGHLLYAAPIIGLTPVEIQKVSGSWVTTATLNPLVAYGIGIGEYNTDAQGNYTVQPYVGINAFISGGVTANLQGSFQVGGLATFYKWFGIGGGYDIATKNPFLCTTFKFDISNFNQGAGFSKIKTFK